MDFGLLMDSLVAEAKQSIQIKRQCLETKNQKKKKKYYVSYK